jgi:MFS family permease
MALQSVFALGTILGVLTLPLISDIKGKKMAFYMCLTCMFVGNLGLFTGILKKSYILIGISQVLSGYGSISASIVSYSINSDFFSDDRRQKAVMFYCVAW